MIKVVTYIILFILTACGSSKKTASERIPMMSGFTDQDYKMTVKHWNFVMFKDSFEIQIIEYYPAYTRCGRGIENALAITLKGSDTIRIIDQCPGSMDYKEGDMLLFKPASIPPQDNSLGLIYIDGGPNPSIFEYPEVKLTTFGELRK